MPPLMAHARAGAQARGDGTLIAEFLAEKSSEDSARVESLAGKSTPGRNGLSSAPSSARTSVAALAGAGLSNERTERAVAALPWIEPGSQCAGLVWLTRTGDGGYATPKSEQATWVIQRAAGSLESPGHRTDRAAEAAQYHTYLSAESRIRPASLPHRAASPLSPFTPFNLAGPPPSSSQAGAPFTYASVTTVSRTVAFATVGGVALAV
jgi:hypothetical protein